MPYVASTLTRPRLIPRPILRPIKMAYMELCEGVHTAPGHGTWNCMKVFTLHRDTFIDVIGYFYLSLSVLVSVSVSVKAP